MHWALILVQLQFHFVHSHINKQDAGQRVEGNKLGFCLKILMKNKFHWAAVGVYFSPSICIQIVFFFYFGLVFNLHKPFSD